MACYLALDGGGTKTETVIFDETGRIFRRDTAPGCVAMDIGAEEAARRLTIVLQNAARYVPGGIPAYTYCGQSSVHYYGEELLEPLKEPFRDWPISWQDGGLSIISSMIDQREGCCLVSGTGATLFARTKDGLKHIGGWGYLLDTVGSGFSLGRFALQAALRSTDSCGPKTVLYDLIREQMCRKPEDSIPIIYRGGRAYIASFASAVFEGRKAGDRVAREIFEKCAGALAELTWAANPFFDSTFDVVMSGGIMLNYPEYAEAVRAKATPKANMIRADIPPIVGSALEAVWRSGAVPSEDFKQRFMQDYRQLKAGQQGYTVRFDGE